MSHVDIEVRDEGGDPVGPGQPGELAVRGPNTCVGLLRRSRAHGRHVRRTDGC